MTLRLVLILAVLGLPAWAQQEVDAVAEGKKAFETYGCMVCHVVAKDAQLLAGPSLYGLFVNEPREREVSDPKSGAISKVKADKGYYLDWVVAAFFQ